MKRVLIAAIVAAALVIPNTAQAYVRPQGPCTAKSYWITRDMSLATRRYKAKRLIVCVFNHIDPAQTQEALYIAGRESGFDPFAYNVSGAEGLFQHMQAYWCSRVNTYLTKSEFPNQYPSVSPFRARANAFVTARMVRAQGWGAWSTYP